MKTKATPPTRTLLVLFVAASLLPLVSQTRAADARKNPTSKLYVADVEGEVSINTGDKIEDLTKKSVHSAEGVIVETKPDARNAIVLSNGTGIAFDPDTRLEVQRFQQEPFSPNRTDLETEPSISQTKVFIPRGGVGICSSKLVAGSSMIYSTRHTDVSIRARKVVIETNDNQTVVSLLEGDVTVGGSLGGGQSIKPGQQAIITRSSSSEPPQIRIQPIPEADMEAIGDKASMACMARRTVYFDTAERKDENANADGIFAQNDSEEADVLVPVEVLPGTILGPSTVSPFEIRRTVIR